MPRPATARLLRRPKTRHNHRLLLVIVLLFAAGYLYSRSQPATNLVISSPANVVSKSITSAQVTAFTGSTTSINLPAGSKVTTDLPSFATATPAQITLQPQKAHAGSYTLTIDSDSATHTYIIEVKHQDINITKLSQEIENILGSAKQRFGVGVKDMMNPANTLFINPGDHFYPGSIAKVPVVVLVLKDIDSGKIKFDDTYPVLDKNKHSRTDSIGRLAQGTRVSVRTYIEKTILESNNTAMYSLRDMLGGIDEVERRSKAELNLYHFDDAPHHIVAPVNVIDLYEGLYRHTVLTSESSEFLIGLMKQTLPSLREAIPRAVPDKSIAIANKVGFINSLGKVAYGDTAIVYGQHTDYLIAVVSKDTSWDEGIAKIRQIAKVVHEYLDR